MLKSILFTLFIVTSTTTYCQNTTGKDFSILPQLAWKFSTSKPIYASPVTDGNTIYVGALDSNFYAIDMASGKLKWQFKTRGEIRSTALLVNNTACFISGDGNLYCIDTNGKKRWMFTGKERKYDFADYHQSSPVLFNNILYVGMGNGNLYAVDPATGKLKWKVQTGGPVHTTPAVDSNRIYFGSFDGNVYAADINTGKVVWKFKTVGHFYFPKGEVQGDPALTKNTVIVGARDYNVYAINKEKGYAHWNKAYSRGWMLSNTFKDSILYMAGADERILVALELKTMKEKWKRNMELLTFGKPAFSANMLYIGTTIGKLHGIDVHTGEDKWVFTTDSYKKNHLEYFKEDDSYRDDIFSIVKSNEDFLDAQVRLGGIFSTALVYNNYLFFTSTEGALYCLKQN
ncbi:MAG: PQQ-like beta-propeller repeat protein [Ferruginibacter sp.]